MISYLVFCHKKESEKETISLSGQASGFVIIPEVLKDIFRKGESVYLGEASINGANELGDGNKGSKIKLFGDEAVVLHSNASSAFPNSVFIIERFNSFLETHPLSIQQELLARKVLLAAFREKEANAPYIYFDLEECTEAPLLLSVLAFVFPGSDLLLSVPENLAFLLPHLGQTARPDIEWLNPISQKEGYVNLFSDIIGIKAADPNNPIREENKNSKTEKKEIQTTPKAGKSAKAQGKEKPKKEFSPEENRRDARWNYFFGLLFSLLAIVAPYFFFLFKNEKENLYFAIYFVLQIFFLFMSFVPVCYNTIVEKDLSKGFQRLTKISIPLIALVASFALYFVGRSKGWVGTQLYCFGIAYLCLPPIAPLMLKVFRILRAKKLAKRK